MFKQVVFFSQANAEAQEAVSNWAVISITTPAEPDAVLKPGWHSVLRLKFEDTDDASCAGAFGDGLARTVVDFVRGLEDPVEGILVHCFAGISRSAAVAKFIADTYKLRFPDTYASYNKLIYRRLNQVIWREAYGDDVDY